MLQLLCTVTALLKLDTMAELGKMLKELLGYSWLTQCNNNFDSELYTKREEAYSKLCTGKEGFYNGPR